MKIPFKIVKDREGQIEFLKSRSAKLKSKTNLFLLIFLICFLGVGIYFLDSLLKDFYLIIGDKSASKIVAISQGIVSIFIFAIVLGIILGHFLSIVSVKYTKDDLLLDNCELIKKLESEIDELKRHNQAAQKGQPGHSASEHSEGTEQ